MAEKSDKKPVDKKPVVEEQNVSAVDVGIDVDEKKIDESLKVGVRSGFKKNSPPAQTLQTTNQHYHGQAVVWVFIEKLHTTTASECLWDKRGEFFVEVNDVRFPSKGKIYMHKNELWNCSKPRAIYCEFMKDEKARCELDIRVIESDPIFNDTLLKVQLDQPVSTAPFTSPIHAPFILFVHMNCSSFRARIVAL